jgi:hypothetical protein
MAWNDLTPAQQAAWKKKNFNTNIRVPQSAIDKLMAGKTKANNIKKYSGTNSKVMREAMNRFYGKGWDKGGSGGGDGGNGGGGKGGTKPYKPGPMIDRPNMSDVPRRTIRSIEGSKGYSAPKKGGSNAGPKRSKYEENYKKMTGKYPNQKTKKEQVTSVTPTIMANRVSDKNKARGRQLVGTIATLTGVGGAARLATTGAIRAGQYAMGRGAAQVAQRNLANQAAAAAAKKTAAAAAKKTAAKKAAAAAAKPAAKTAASKTTAAAKTAAKKPVNKPAVKTPTSKPASKPINKPAAKTAAKPTAKPVNRTTAAAKKTVAKKTVAKKTATKPTTRRTGRP